MCISVANLIDQESLLSHAQGGNSRPLRCEDYGRGVVLIQTRLVTQKLVYRVVQTNPLAPSLLYSQAMQGNHNNSSLAIIGLGRIIQELICQLS